MRLVTKELKVINYIHINFNNNNNNNNNNNKILLLKIHFNKIK